MENLGKKVGFLKGLMEGMSFDTDSANGKLMAGIVDLLGDLSDRVEAIDELLQDLNDYVESIDEDLTELEGARDDDMDGLFDGEDDDDDFDDDMMFNSGEGFPSEPGCGSIHGKVAMSTGPSGWPKPSGLAPLPSY